MKGLLVVNGFINNNIGVRFNNLYEMLIEAFKELNTELIIKKNSDLLISINYNNLDHYDFVLFWDKDIKLANHLENLGYKLFNSAKAIEVCDDKAKTYLALENKGIKMPKTIIPPFTFSNNPYNNYDFLDEVIEKLGLPLVMKECFGSFGEQVYLVKSKEEIIDIIKRIFPKEFLFQEFISSSFGKDIRVEVVNGKALGAVMRIQDNGDFRSNVLQGGKMVKTTPDESYLRVSEKAIIETGCSFGGVDILIGENNEPILCEVNSNVHFKTFYTITGINLAKEIAKYVIDEINK